MLESPTARYVKSLNSALSHNDVVWAYFHMLDHATRTAMDNILVARKHPLAYVPGSNEQRFRQLHREGFRF